MRLRLIIAALILNCSISFGQTFPTDTLIYNGPGENRINLVFLGDGYLAEDLDKYITDIGNITTQLFNTTPFKEYSAHFNVIAIKVPSNERGAARDPSNLIDNYFGSTYNFADIDRLLVPTKNGVVASVLADNFPQYDQAFVLVNDDKYGGSGGWLATSSTNASAGEIAIHEIGHSMAGLADEYWAGSQFARETANMTQETNPLQVKWANWMGDLDIGIFAHSGDATWKKPHQNCKMQFLGAPFCAVCNQTFINTFNELTINYDDFTPESQNGLNNQNNFDVSTLEPTPNTLKTWWLLNGDTLTKNNSTLSVANSDFLNGPNELKLTLVDTTALSRLDVLHAQSITWTIDTSTSPETISSNQTQFMINRADLVPDIVTSIDDPFIQEIGFKAYPNPTSDLLTITFSNTKTVKFNLQLVGIDGQTHQNMPDRTLLPGNQVFEINTAQLKKGIYLVQMVVGDRLVVHKILK